MKSIKPTNRFHRRGNWIVSVLLAGSVMGLSLQISAIYAQPARSLYSKNQVPKGIEVFQDAVLTAAAAGQSDVAVYPGAEGPAAPEQPAPRPDLVVYPGAAAVRQKASISEAGVRSAARREMAEAEMSAKLTAPTGGAVSAADSVPSAPDNPDEIQADSEPAGRDWTSVSDDAFGLDRSESVGQTETTEAESDAPETGDGQADDNAEASDGGPSVTTTLAITNPTVLLTETRTAAIESETHAAEPAAPAYARAAITDVSEDTVALYMGIMATECGSAWDYEGCLMIAQVIVNRVHSGYWGDLYQVLTAPNQFSTYSSGVWATRQPTEAQRQAAVDALAGKTVIDEDVLFFCTDAAYQRSAYFQSLDHRVTYANTMFFAK